MNETSNAFLAPPPAIVSLPKADPPPMFNNKEPKYHLPYEQPWHRQAAYFFATGVMSIKEVASALEKSPSTVSNLLKNKWFQEIVMGLMAEQGAGDILALFRAEAFNSLVTLVEIRDNEKAKPSDRIASAKDILDRGHGKPVQRMESVEVPHSSDPTAEVKRLEADNLRLQTDLGFSPPQ